MHECFLLSIASVDCKQHLSEVVFKTLLGFSLYTTCTYQRIKQSPKSTTEMYSVAYVMLCGARDRSCGQQAIGASIRTMLQHIPSTWFRHFLQKSQTPVVCKSPYSPYMAPCEFWVWLFRVVSCKRAPLKSTRFSQKNKFGHFCNSSGNDYFVNEQPALLSVSLSFFHDAHSFYYSFLILILFLAISCYTWDKCPSEKSLFVYKKCLDVWTSSWA